MRLMYTRVRRDRVIGPRCGVATAAMKRCDGWCDDPADGRYNRPIRLPAGASHEEMWREDRLYDIVGVLDWNLRPRVRGGGSAIFLHVAREGFAPTAGCIALRLGDLKRLLAQAGPRPVIQVAAKARVLRDGRSRLNRLGRKS